ncbi:hypothetical protein [Planctomicrobium piriforme]|uniref:Uncharacterized protein n=1 Tax=Planctomicrobium piriforme TaxID=1576369 RepID=A0A1I3EGQ3_9PLAN|nr:hypothetical protein [Planctomicrobium piriforme]SFH98119.1 hypothetical protein SAMN05421753_104214 [Planctomicrobium piriforme]
MTTTTQLTGQALDDRVRFLLTGDDGSVGDNADRLNEAVCEYANLNGGPAELFDNVALTNAWQAAKKIGLAMWNLRERHFVKEPLESHVASYREPAASLETMELIQQTGRKIQEHRPHTGCWLEVEFNTDHVEWRLTEAPDRKWHECSYEEFGEQAKLAAVEALEALKAT